MGRVPLLASGCQWLPLVRGGDECRGVQVWRVAGLLAPRWNRLSSSARSETARSAARASKLQAVARSSRASSSKSALTNSVSAHTVNTKVCTYKN